jgi:hypothetical protein
MQVRRLAAACGLTFCLAAPASAQPLFGTTTVDANGAFWGLDLAFNPERAEFLVVYPALGEPVQNDLQLRARRYREMGDPVGTSWLLSDVETNVMPAVAYDQHTRRYLVVWQRVLDDNQVQLVGQLLDTLGQPIGGQFVVDGGAAPRFLRRPAIAARNHREHGTADVAFAVAFETNGSVGSDDDDNEVKVVRVRGDGSLVSATSVGIAQRPAIAYDPVLDRFQLAYGQGSSVVARTMSIAGALSAGTTTVASSRCGSSEVSLAFDIASRRQLVVYGVLDAQGRCDLRGSLLTAATTPAVAGTLTLGSAYAGGSYQFHDISAEPGSFLVAYRRSTGSGSSGTHEIFTHRLRADGLFLNGTFWANVDHDSSVATATGVHGSTPVLLMAPFESGQNGSGWPVRLGMADRWFARHVHGASAGDFDGDGRSDLFAFQPHTSLFMVRTQSTTNWYVFAVPGGVPALLDWDGDGRTDLSVWEPATGKWWIRQSRDGNTVTPILGQAGDVPVPGDYLGLGRDQVAVFRPSTVTWIIRSSIYGRPTTKTFGQAGDMPTPADWDGDGDIDLGMWQPSTGVWTAARLDGTAIAVPSSAYGQAGDFPLAGNFTGNGIADQVVFRRQLGVYYRRDGSTAISSTVTASAGIPVPLDWNGDGLLDVAVFDLESGTCTIKVGSQTETITFGGIGSIPVGAR